MIQKGESMKKWLLSGLFVLYSITNAMDEDYVHRSKKTRRFTFSSSTQNSSTPDPQIPLLAALYHFYHINPVTKIKDLRKIIASFLWRQSDVSTELIKLLMNFLQATGEPRIVLSHESLITSLAVNQEGNQLFIAGLNVVNSWDIKNVDMPIKRLSFSAGIPNIDLIYINSLAIRPDNHYCVLAGMDIYSVKKNGIIQVWDIRKANAAVVKKQLEPSHFREAMVVAFNKEGTLLLSGSMDHTLKLWDTNDIERIYQLAQMEQEGGVQSAVFTPDNNHVIASTWNKVKIWDIGKRTCPLVIDSFTIPRNRWPQVLDLSQRERYLEIKMDKSLYQSDQVVKLWNANNLKRPSDSQGVFATVSPAIQGFAVSANGSYVVTRSERSAHLWQINEDQSMVCLARLNSHEGESSCLLLGNEGQYIASAKEKSVSLTNLEAIKWMENVADMEHYLLLKEVLNYKNTHQHSSFPLTNHLLQEIYCDVPQTLQKALAHSGHLYLNE